MHTGFRNRNVVVPVPISIYLRPLLLRGVALYSTLNSGLHTQTTHVQPLLIVQPSTQVFIYKQHLCNPCSLYSTFIFIHKQPLQWKELRAPHRSITIPALRIHGRANKHTKIQTHTAGQRWANSVLMTEYEYEYYSTFKKWPNTNTNIREGLKNPSHGNRP